MDKPVNIVVFPLFSTILLALVGVALYEHGRKSAMLDYQSALNDAKRNLRYVNGDYKEPRPS